MSTPLIERHSADDEVANFASLCMWAGMHPYHPWMAAYPQASLMSADVIQQIAATAFGWRACDLTLRVH